MQSPTAVEEIKSEFKRGRTSGQTASDLETPRKVARTEDDHNGNGCDLQESGYESSLEMSIEVLMDKDEMSSADQKESSEDCSQSDDFPNSIRVDEDSQDLPFEERIKNASGAKNRMFAENVQHCEITISQNSASQQKKTKKGKKTSNPDEVMKECKSSQDIIMEKVCALLNSGGGILSMHISDCQTIPAEDLHHRVDMFWKTLEPKLKDLAKPSDYNKVFDRHTGSSELLLFINSPRHLCSVEYNLYLSGDAETSEASHEQVVAFLKRPTGKKMRSSNVDVPLRGLLSLPEAFTFGKRCGFPESKEIQLKNYETAPILKNHSQREKVARHISASANTNGGQILLGIKDSGQVVGVNMKENDKDEIVHRVTSMIDDMIFPVIPEKKVHWDIEFIPVFGSETMGPRQVVVIKVAGMKSFGGVFKKRPKSYELQQDTIQLIEFKQWKERMLSGMDLWNESTAMNHICSKLKKVDLSQGVCPVLTVEGHAQKIRDSFFIVEKGFPVTPEGFQENLPTEVKSIITEIQKLCFRTRGRGVIVASKSWLANLGELPNDHVLCDLLVIGTEMGGIHLYTVCEEGSEDECLVYSKEVSQMIKRSLVRAGGCPARVYVSYHVVSHSSKVEWPLPDKRYPRSYDLQDREHLNVVLMALVVLLAQVPSHLSNKMGVSIMYLLTKEQFELVNKQIHINRELWIKGVAGTGKTLVAIEVIKKIRRLKKLEKDEILYVGENKGIIQHVREANVCHAVCRETFMNDSFPKVRHLIMDEVHNYRAPNPWESWYSKARETVLQHDPRDPGYLWIFLDKYQTNHVFETGIPPTHLQQPEFVLETIIRNSRCIFNHATKQLSLLEGFSKDQLVLGHNFTGEKVTVVPYSSSEESQSEVLTRTIKKLYKEGYIDRDIAVLFSKSEEIPREVLPFSFRTCTETENSLNMIVVSTVSKYSGLDRPVVILVDLLCSIPYGRVMPSFRYSAETRAMVKLVIIRCEVCQKRNSNK